MTKREMFEAIKVAVADNAEMVDFLDHQIDLLKRKQPSDNSKARLASEARANIVYEALAQVGEPVTVTELMRVASGEEFQTYTNQRISALLRNLGKQGRVKSEKVKGKTYFSVIA